MSEPTQRCDICGGAYFGVDPDGICPSCEKAAQANEEQRGVLARVRRLENALAISAERALKLGQRVVNLGGADMNRGQWADLVIRALEGCENEEARHIVKLLKEQAQ